MNTQGVHNSGLHVRLIYTLQLRGQETTADQHIQATEEAHMSRCSSELSQHSGSHRSTMWGKPACSHHRLGTVWGGGGRQHTSHQRTRPAEQLRRRRAPETELERSTWKRTCHAPDLCTGPLHMHEGKGPPDGCGWMPGRGMEMT